MFKKMHFLKTMASFMYVTVVCFMSSTFAQDIKWSWNNPGEFYLYSLFKKGPSVFLGGADVDSYGNYIYVNRTDFSTNGYYLDVYTISVADTAKVNQHPDNPQASGPVEKRTLTRVKTYNIPKLAIRMNGELYAVKDGVHFLGRGADESDVFYYDFSSGATSVICDNKNTEIVIHLLGYDDIRDVWYGGHTHHGSNTRIVYSFNQAKKEWEKEFDYEDMKGGHFDGMEVIATQKETNIYISDMTSDYIGIVSNESGSWKTVSINKYNDGDAGFVEGMGYGAFHHFWITSGHDEEGDYLYEIGGGGLTVVESPETVTVSIPVEQTFSVEELSPGGTLVGDINIISSNASKAKIKIINIVPEFEVNSQSPFTITVANGANLDFNTQNTYQLTVVAYTDAGIVTTPDTSIVTIHILQKTGIAAGFNKGLLNTASFSIKGDNLIIKGLTEGAYTLSITNLKGQEMRKIENGSKTVIVDISSVPSGIYFTALTSKNRKVFNKIHITRLGNQ